MKIHMPKTWRRNIYYFLITSLVLFSIALIIYMTILRNVEDNYIIIGIGVVMAICNLVPITFNFKQYVYAEIADNTITSYSYFLCRKLCTIFLDKYYYAFHTLRTRFNSERLIVISQSYFNHSNNGQYNRFLHKYNRTRLIVIPYNETVGSALKIDINGERIE